MLCTTDHVSSTILDNLLTTFIRRFIFPNYNRKAVMKGRGLKFCKEDIYKSLSSEYAS